MTQNPSPVLSGVRYIKVQAEEAGQRIDNYLLRVLKDVPRSHIYRLLRSGQVRVNKGRAKPMRKLSAGDEIRLPPLRRAEVGVAARPPDAMLERVRDTVLQEDDELLVVNKPPGLAAHAGTDVRFGMIEALRAARPDLSYLELAHRLDRDTSGVLVLAKTRTALTALHRALRERSAHKTYLALVAGNWPDKLRHVRLALVKNAVRGGERMVEADESAGKEAHSEFEVVQRFGRLATLVRVTLHTGRTHQIRAHAELSGHPVAGDPKYGERETDRRLREYGLKRMFLHAERLRVDIPGGRYDLRAPLPADLEQILERLRK
ncbi:MAG: RluA family pseudouridine synthase [Nevskiales bacterium]